LKRSIAILIVLTLLISNAAGLAESYALTLYKEVTKYHLDMGVVHIWGTGSSKETATYQNGLAYGGEYNFTVTIEFPNEIKSVTRAYQLDESSFIWDNSSGIYSFNSTTYLKDTDSYLKNYSYYVSNLIENIVPTLADSKTVKLSYKAKLKSARDYDLAEGLRLGNFDTIIDLLGGKDKVKPDLYEILEQGAENGVGPGVYGFIFFIPIVIEYKVLEAVQLEEGDFIASLDAPASARPEEEFEVVDTSVFSDESQFAFTKLYYSVDGGSERLVSGWKGTSLGESITQSFPSECTVTYTISVWNNLGTEKRASKTVAIQDEYNIEINADLELPEYTYEGHAEIAKDQSTFKVDGVDYSASRMYAEKLASNNFKANSSTIGVHKIDNTRAECTFPQTGTYNVTLEIRAGKARGSDTESIEVRKTPYIIDTLTGVQKQNRKQILSITVATYPGEPLTDYSITLKDKVTGGLIRLTPDNPQENTSTIKTRAVTMTQDIENGFAYITLEFLTKTPSYYSTGTSTQDFYYEIHVTDSKGDTDTASKTFSVMPDLPPEPAISIEPEFLRNRGTNTASIIAEDVTVAVDGDGVERTWHYGATTAPAVFTDVSTMDGYKKLSFGTDKIVGFDRTGVGKFTVKLAVKEVWTEPSLEEYVTDADRLSAEILAYSDVLNVAPIVALELTEAIPKNVLIIANNDAEYNTAIANKVSLKQALLANKIDANIVIKKLLGSTPNTSLETKMHLTSLPTPLWYYEGMAGGMQEETWRYDMIADSERVYVEQWTWLPKSPTVPAYVKAYNPLTGTPVWTYSTTNPENMSLGQDDIGKYLYVIYTDQTVILDKKTGAVAGTIPLALPNQIWLTDDSFYTIESGAFYRIDQTTLQKTRIDNGVSTLARVGNLFKYLTFESTGVIMNDYNPADGTIIRKLLVDTTNGKGSADSDYIPVGIGSDGNIILYKQLSRGTDSFIGFRIYSGEGALAKEISADLIPRGRQLNWMLPSRAEDGKINHVMVNVWNDSTNRAIWYAVNIPAGKVVSPSITISTYYSKPSVSTLFETNGVTYLFVNGWYVSSGYGYNGHRTIVTFNGNTFSTTNTVGSIGNNDENYVSSDRYLATFYGNNDNANGGEIKITALVKTATQELTEVLARFTDKTTYVGNATTTADQIKNATLNQPTKTVKVNADRNGYLYLNNLSLIPGNKYYYEYEIKPLTSGTESGLNGMTATTGTVTSNQSFIGDTLYVESSYEETFNGGPINPFFTVDDPGVIADNYFNSDTSYPNAKGYGAVRALGDSYMKLSFTVPSGRYATVTFDSSLLFNNHYGAGNEYYAGTNVFIDGLRVTEQVVYGNNHGPWIYDDGDYTDFHEYKHGRVFYKLLGAGTHTIECKVSAPGSKWDYVLIDNLKVDILSPTPKTYGSTFNKQNGDSKGWLGMNGSFEIPNKVISYGAQAATKYYGGMPSEVVRYDKSGYPDIVNYYHTVPAGYIHKGKVHLGSIYRSSKRSVITYKIQGVFNFRIECEYGSTVNTWVDLGARTPGTYTHVVETTSPDRQEGCLDAFDLIIYPYNEVTATGNIAFNSDNTKYFFPKVTSTGKTNLSMFIPKGEYLIKNLRLYYIENGMKIYLQNKALENAAELSNWTFSSGLTATDYSEPPTEEEEAPVKIYKKGEKVIYDIFYDDYEEDPSKRQYWRYAHINWPPDGVHPDAGRILDAPIDRFYLSGKYTVTHWQQDNTQRSGTTGDAAPYNKESNQVNLTFYVNGEGAAPWVTYIKTNPPAVKENNTYTLAIGVDDSEKDTLTLETEVYLNGTSIFTHRRENLQANEAGEYPETLISGLPAAKVGIYQVICTVSDWSGTGLGTYRFTVVSEGKVTGFVNHTDQWDDNRKKYNLKRFGEEVNRPMSLDYYMAMPAPRMRGTNVFWSGEKFILLAETEGEPEKVDVRIQAAGVQGGRENTGYITDLTDTGRKSPDGADIWEGSLWSDTMINKWGRKSPEPLYFIFTAYYGGGAVRTSEAMVIIDSRTDYWQLHRLW